MITKSIRATAVPAAIVGLLSVGLAAKIERYGRLQPMSAVEAIDRAAASLARLGWRATETVANEHGLDLASATLRSPNCPGGLELVAFARAPELVAFARSRFGESLRSIASPPDVSAAGFDIAIAPLAGHPPCRAPGEKL